MEPRTTDGAVHLPGKGWCLERVYGKRMASNRGKEKHIDDNKSDDLLIAIGIGGGGINIKELKMFIPPIPPPPPTTSFIESEGFLTGIDIVNFIKTSQPTRNS